jgi:hypothetical protein
MSKRYRTIARGKSHSTGSERYWSCVLTIMAVINGYEKADVKENLFSEYQYCAGSRDTEDLGHPNQLRRKQRQASKYSEFRGRATFTEVVKSNILQRAHPYGPSIWSFSS